MVNSLSVQRLTTNPLEAGALVTTYLQMRTPDELRTANRASRSETFEIRELNSPNWKFNREMYFKVGEKWNWTDKRPWTDDQWKEYASDLSLRTFAAYFGGQIAGYYELKRTSDGGHPQSGRETQIVEQKAKAEIEIAYFGLLPDFIGRGLGGVLLTSAIESAWSWLPAPTRLWVHTCNRDHPAALANYQARGFQIYRTSG